MITTNKKFYHSIIRKIPVSAMSSFTCKQLHFPFSLFCGHRLKKKKKISDDENDNDYSDTDNDASSNLSFLSAGKRVPLSEWKYFLY